MSVGFFPERHSLADSRTGCEVHFAGGGWGFKDQWKSVEDIKEHLGLIKQSEPVPSVSLALLTSLKTPTDLM